MMLLSICIPSYNRFDNLSQIIESLKTCCSNDFEVVIVDNCSKGNVEDIVPQSDHRFRIIHRDKGVKGTLNCRQSLDYGQGVFCMLLLDKDFIEGAALEFFLNELRGNSDISCGICALNCKNKKTDTRISSPQKNLSEMYIMRHPSGMFIRKAYILDDTQKASLSDLESANAGELVFARALMAGKLMYFDYPMVFTETEEAAASTPSYTYSRENVWFHPRQQMGAFDRYCKHLYSLKLSEKQNVLIVKYIFMRLMEACTFGYKSIMENEKICKHYMIELADIPYEELSNWKKAVDLHFVQCPLIKLSKVEKRKILIAGTFKYKMKWLRFILKAKGNY